MKIFKYAGAVSKTNACSSHMVQNEINICSALISTLCKSMHHHIQKINTVSNYDAAADSTITNGYINDFPLEVAAK